MEDDSRSRRQRLQDRHGLVFGRPRVHDQGLIHLDRETAWNPDRSAASCTSTETAPYALVLGRAKKRSATSRWTITHQSSTDGSPSRLSTISGVATLYGRFATSFVGGGASAARSTVSASSK